MSGESETTTEQPFVIRPWRTERVPAVVGINGAAKICGISRSTFSRWIEKGSGDGEGYGEDDTYMIPPARFDDGTGDTSKGTPFWVKSDVVRFAEERGRRRRPNSPK